MLLPGVTSLATGEGQIINKMSMNCDEMDAKIQQLKKENEFLYAENKELRAQNFELEKAINVKSKRDAPRPKQANCGTSNSCQTCVQSATCGWCYSSNQCQEGHIKGPLAQNCSNWGYAFCQGEACSHYKNCGSCVNDPFCGWCKSAMACVEGTDVGPIVGRCRNWEHSKCGAGDHIVNEDGADVQELPSYMFSNGKSAFKQIRLNSIQR